jgi:hypothetical protein
MTKHQEKVKIAKKLITKKGKGKHGGDSVKPEKGSGIFGSIAWDVRKKSIAQRVQNLIDRIKKAKKK